MPGVSFDQIIEILSRRISEALPQPVRLFHGRGHLHPGLEHINIDWYPPVLQIILYEVVSYDQLGRLTNNVIGADVHNQISSIISDSSRSMVYDHRTESPNLLPGSILPVQPRRPECHLWYTYCLD